MWWWQKSLLWHFMNSRSTFEMWNDSYGTDSRTGDNKTVAMMVTRQQASVINEKHLRLDGVTKHRCRWGNGSQSTCKALVEHTQAVLLHRKTWCYSARFKGMLHEQPSSLLLSTEKWRAMLQRVVQDIKIDRLGMPFVQVSCSFPRWTTPSAGAFSGVQHSECCNGSISLVWAQIAYENINIIQRSWCAPLHIRCSLPKLCY